MWPFWTQSPKWKKMNQKKHTFQAKGYLKLVVVRSTTVTTNTTAATQTATAAFSSTSVASFNTPAAAANLQQYYNYQYSINISLFFVYWKCTK